MIRTRDEHVAFCKSRALAYVGAGDLQNAFASLCSDLRGHPETEDHGAMMLGTMLMMVGHLDTPHAMRKFIEDVH